MTGMKPGYSDGEEQNQRQIHWSPDVDGVKRDRKGLQGPEKPEKTCISSAGSTDRVLKVSDDVSQGRERKNWKIGQRSKIEKKTKINTGLGSKKMT